ncbi:hypothetical protein [Rubinisphaera sp.]|uniref:hypothetical protein n=1 Tax=Rubinisphaera sp. TaxID=2024857 RepID=UPI000C11E705|nr:hypothetical protein [Rubinisphaera sp.]MBV09180.1 hypothetical protein [Rubinisphaera sp.]
MDPSTSLLKLSERIQLLPVVHGSGDYAIEVRRILLSEKFDCLAIPLPEPFQASVETAVHQLPVISVVWQNEQASFETTEWQPDSFLDEEDDDDDFDDESATYVPIDPCQPVIAAIRIAMQEHIPRAFIDPEVSQFEVIHTSLPDPYAVKRLHAEAFTSATTPVLSSPQSPQLRYRIRHMAERLRELEQTQKSILCLCSFSEWMLIKAAYDNQEPTDSLESPPPTPVHSATVAQKSLIFALGELPYITSLYEAARFELDNDENLSVDGIKQLLLRSRDVYVEEFKKRARPITPKLLGVYFRYIRNLSLIERRLTPDLYTLVIAAQQVFGDQFAIILAEVAREYGFSPPNDTPHISMGIDQARLPDGDVVTMKTRLPGHPISWRSCNLQSRPQKHQQKEWLTSWNHYAHCSWPPEDNAIENFRSHVKDQALSMLGNDLAKTEKFTTSLKDGLDIRETLRNWHTGDLYVKEVPPTRGGLDCVVMLFDSPADPRDYPQRITWHAEHYDESTLSFYASNYLEEMVGPGIALGRYGGAMFLFPPRPIRDIWRDSRFDFVDTLEERLIVAGAHHSREKHIALLSEKPPGIAWKKLAQRSGKKIIHVPLNKFSQQTIQQLRMFHVLNGQHVRAYASEFIRKS